jgi:hypothetical protein
VRAANKAAKKSTFDSGADRQSTGPGCASKIPVCTGPGGAACFGVKLQQPQQPRVLRTQSRCHGTELREFLCEPRGLRWLEIVVHGTHRRSDGQMPACLRRWMRVGLRACVCRKAVVRNVNVS